LAYLQRQQRPDGSWIPLWFGNQDHPREENPLYGTARVLLAYRDLGLIDSLPAKRGLKWLADNQNADGGWGGSHQGASPPRSSVEETALAVEALAAHPAHAESSLRAAVAWLVEAVKAERLECTPIGFYFAKLWYYERLYPLTFTVSALRHAMGCGLPTTDTPDWHAGYTPAHTAHV
jgi:squalene-hopene/tetraprenyl-beta-curcumene cyclase